MIRCVSIKNVYTKKIIACNYATNDIIKFMHDMFVYQPQNVLFLYKFNNESNYITAHNDKDFIIEPVNNEAEYKMIEEFCDVNCDNDDKKVQRIIDNVSKFANQNSININFDKNELTDFLTKLKSDKNIQKVYKARDKYVRNLSETKINQQGGVVIWLIEKYMFPKLPSTIRMIFTSILEIIDAVLIVGISIPGLQFAAGLGIIVDIISFIYCFLRFDVLGMVASLIALIPILGNIVGGFMRITAKSLKYYKKYKQYKAHKRLLRMGTESFVQQQLEQVDQQDGK